MAYPICRAADYGISSSHRPTGPAFERVKELKSSGISTVRPSRQPLRGFLRMRTFLNAVNGFPSC